MGLDMWIRRVHKPNLEDRVYTTDELRNAGLSYSLEEELKDEMHLIAQLLPYTIKRNVECQFYDVRKMITDYDLPDDSHIGMYSYDGVTLYGRRNDEYVQQFVSDERIKEKYTLTKTLPCYIWESEEVQYWRKAYDIQDWFYDRIEGIDNCGYYLLDGELLADLNEIIDEYVPVEDPTNEHALFYHEWY